MKFSHDDSKLAVLSDKHTLHVYNIDETQYQMMVAVVAQKMEEEEED